MIFADYCCCAPILCAVCCGGGFNGTQVGQQQLLKRFRNGNVIYAHISREALILWFQCTQCQYDVVTGLLDVAMSHFVELYAKEVFDIMQNPALCTRPDTKKAIRDVLAFAAKEVPPLIEHFSKTWPVQDFPKLPAEITSKLRVGAFYHSSLGGVFVRYVLCGKSVAAHHHQVRACMQLLSTSMNMIPL